MSTNVQSNVRQVGRLGLRRTSARNGAYGRVHRVRLRSDRERRSGLSRQHAAHRPIAENQTGEVVGPVALAFTYRNLVHEGKVTRCRMSFSKAHSLQPGYRSSSTVRRSAQCGPAIVRIGQELRPGIRRQQVEAMRVPASHREGRARGSSGAPNSATA